MGLSVSWHWITCFMSCCIAFFRVSDLRHFVIAARPSMAAMDFVLMTTFPNKELSDESKTLQQANLLNAVIVQRIKWSGLWERHSLVVLWRCCSPVKSAAFRERNHGLVYGLVISFFCFSKVKHKIPLSTFTPPSPCCTGKGWNLFLTSC